MGEIRGETRVREGANLERLGAQQQVGQVEVGDVVARDDICVARHEELLPLCEQLRLLLEREDLLSRNLASSRVISRGPQPLIAVPIASSLK